MSPMQLCRVELKRCPALSGAVRRILAESSPMYALMEDAAPTHQCASFFDLMLFSAWPVQRARVPALERATTVRP